MLLPHSPLYSAQQLGALSAIAITSRDPPTDAAHAHHAHLLTQPFVLLTTLKLSSATTHLLDTSSQPSSPRTHTLTYQLHPWPAISTQSVLPLSISSETPSPLFPPHPPAITLPPHNSQIRSPHPSLFQSKHSRSPNYGYSRTPSPPHICPPEPIPIPLP